jgi:hypothetical protein
MNTLSFIKVAKIKSTLTGWSLTTTNNNEITLNDAIDNGLYIQIQGSPNEQYVPVSSFERHMRGSPTLEYFINVKKETVELKKAMEQNSLYVGPSHAEFYAAEAKAAEAKAAEAKAAADENREWLTQNAQNKLMREQARIEKERWVAGVNEHGYDYKLPPKLDDDMTLGGKRNKSRKPKRRNSRSKRRNSRSNRTLNKSKK